MLGGGGLTLERERVERGTARWVGRKRGKGEWGILCCKSEEWISRSVYWGLAGLTYCVTMLLPLLLLWERGLQGDFGWWVQYM